MSQCTKCGTNFVGTPEQPSSPGLCKWCEIKQLRDDKFKLRTALFTLVGVNDFSELKPMQDCLRMAPGEIKDRQICIDAIQALIDTA